MNRLWKLFRLGLSACALAALPWAAPRPQAAARRDSPIVHVTQVDESQFPTLKVYISITDSDGEPVGVAPTHLRLAENDIEVKPDQVSGQGEIGPLTTLLIMDASGDMNQAGKLTLAQIAAHAYIDQMHVNDRAGVLAFNADIDYVQPVTTDRAALAKAIDDLKAQGDTPMYGTLLRGVQILESLPGRKAIVLLTDGLDNRSTNTVDQIFERIGPRSLFISTIGLGDPSQLGISTAALDEAALRSLAERAGGNYAYGGDPETLRNLYKRLGHALPHKYVLTYTSPVPLRDGVKRTLTVSLVEEGTATEAEYTPGGVVPEESARTPVQADANLARVMRAIEHLAPEWEIIGGALAGLLVMLCVAVPIRRALIVRRGQPSVGNQVKRQWSRARSHDPASRTSPPPDNPDTSLPVFPNYLQLRPQSRFSLALWEALWASARVGAVVAVLVYVALLFTQPAWGLFLFWRLTIPILPLVFLVAPGAWRNVCPLAASNQMPRLFKWSHALTPPEWLREYGFIIGVGTFFLFASSRKWLFNNSGPATGLLILAALVSAWLGGYLFKGKSGWCTSICPLYPVQRLYNRTPFVTIPNAHCSPCVGCTKNCYDFNPGMAALADLHDNDPHYASYRKFFSAAMPGFVVAYFIAPNPTGPASALAMYLQFALYIVMSVSVFNILSLLKVSPNKLTAVYGAVAFNLFYWFGLPGWLQAAGSVVGLTPPVWLAPVLQVGILAVTFNWIVRTCRKEPLFLDQVRQGKETHAASSAIPVLEQVAQPNPPEITFMPDETRVLVEAGRSLLEIAESYNQPLEAGCRMGACGADPVLIVRGMENLASMGSDEKSTLERLGLGPNCRLACMCRVHGPVTVSLRTQGATASALAPAADFDRSLKRMVIIGNGIAGVTAADYVRRHHPECEIHLIGREKHHLYNRMAISRLIYGRSEMSGLYLQPEAWFDERKITCWLNTHVTHINRGHKHVLLATGETLSYDRLILASGSSSVVPSIPGYGLPGTFVLREAEGAMDIRAYVQRHQCRTAVIAGGGLLGLEAAYALHKMGLTVWVLERGEWLLRRQLDARGGHLLKKHLEAMGLTIVTSAETAAAQGHSRVSRVRLKDGRTIPCGVFLVAVGIQPNVDLAREAGLDVNRGVLVDEAMRTNAPDIFAAGDVCEFAQQVPGLWPVAVEQAKVAAINAVGGQAVYPGVVPVTMLKVVGVDVSSIGRFEAQSAAEIEVVLEDPDGHGYRKLVIAGGKIVGAILLGHPLDVPAVTAAVKEGRDVSDCLNALRAGEWDILSERHPGGRLARFRAPYAGTSIIGGRSRSAISSTSRE
jgi:VWFA-related protein